MKKLKDYTFFEKIFLFILFSLIFSIFLPFSESIFATPFENYEINQYLWLNFFLAILFSVLISHFKRNRLIVLTLVLIILFLIFCFPKVLSYGAGDFGWSEKTYCECYGKILEKKGCCHFRIRYCIGLCLRKLF